MNTLAFNHGYASTLQKIAEWTSRDTTTAAISGAAGLLGAGLSRKHTPFTGNPDTDMIIGGLAGAGLGYGTSREGGWWEQMGQDADNPMNLNPKLLAAYENTPAAPEKAKAFDALYANSFPKAQQKSSTRVANVGLLNFDEDTPEEGFLRINLSGGKNKLGPIPGQS